MATEILALRSQLADYKLQIQQKKKPKPKFNLGFRLLWVFLSIVWKPWKELAQLMQPATVKHWHTALFRFYWRWKCRRVGRPEISKEMKQLIRKLSRENPLWSAERIGDTLRLLGLNAPDPDTIRKYMRRPPYSLHSKSATWLTFLHNHLPTSWGMDFFTVIVANFKMIRVLVILDHGRRQLIHMAVTAHPSMEWVIQQLREATPFGFQPRFLFRDNDGVYGSGVKPFLESCGIEEIRTAFRSPWQNPYVERFIGTLRRDLLDHVIVFNEAHLHWLLERYIQDYYHTHRPHQGLEGQTPIPKKKPPLASIDKTKIIGFPVLGGLHHRYERIAA